MTENGVLLHYLKFLSRNRKSQPQQQQVNTQTLPPEMFSVSEALIVIMDKEEKIVEFNAAAERLSGYTRQEMVGKTLAGLVPQEELGWVSEAIQEVARDNLPYSIENHWLAKDGSKHLIHWAITNIKTPDGKVQYVVGTGLNITEVTQQERRRNLLMNILHTLASSHTEKDTLKAILQQIQDYTGCDAAGIRLRKGQDFPYAEAVGFSDKFLTREASLWSIKTGKWPVMMTECLYLTVCAAV